MATSTPAWYNRGTNTRIICQLPSRTAGYLTGHSTSYQGGGTYGREAGHGGCGDMGRILREGGLHYRPVPYRLLQCLH